MKTLIKGGRVLDPASKTDAVKDVLFEDGVILKVAENITDDAENVIDADGMFVMPGLIRENPYRCESSCKRWIFNGLCHA